MGEPQVVGVWSTGAALPALAAGAAFIAATLLGDRLPSRASLRPNEV